MGRRWPVPLLQTTGTGNLRTARYSTAVIFRYPQRPTVAAHTAGHTIKEHKNEKTFFNAGYKKLAGLSTFLKRIF